MVVQAADLAFWTKQPISFAFIFRRCIPLETLKSTGPFGGDLRHLTQIGRNSEKPGFMVLDRLVIIRPKRPVRNRAAHSQSRGKLGHSLTEEMVLKPCLFKAGAGGGEV